jgi:hypothetical protein
MNKYCFRNKQIERKRTLYNFVLNSSLVCITAGVLFIEHKERSEEAKKIKLHYLVGVISNGRGRIMDIHLV